ncbi:hypothetical protein SAMN05216326_1442 [Nitrosomonas marina]|uniref:Uncharacterized protein n=1 Tax=Nitrosomonas marina TaxID=917 RepID=A0A1I0FTV0_9PROT|nr:hypothetical protein [Nitrosomonas marina]SET60999.1 hypothetical protein SAMN05216326_1442 [Nitrosomonas marina]
MTDTETDLNDYVESLYKTDNFEQAFTVFERYAYKSGLDGVFYIYIPRFPLDNGSPCKPAFNVSHNLNPACISHLFDNGFDQPERPESSHFNAPFYGGIELIEWQKKSCTNCQQIESHATSESTAANSIGIANGIAIKLMSGEKGIAIAGFVRCHSQFGNKNQKQVNLPPAEPEAYRLSPSKGLFVSR